MARVKLIQVREDVAPEHGALFDELAALRGRISGPSSVVLHSPTLARPWNEISEFLHRDSIVEAGAAELAVCATARHYDCGYIWNAHASQARKAGVGEATLTAVRDREALPDDTDAGEAQVVRYVRSLLSRNRVPGDVFAALLAAHGERWMVELTCWIGRYAALAGVLNAFEVSPAEGAEALPELPLPPPERAVRRPLLRPRVRQLTSRDMVSEDAFAVFDAVAEGRGNVRGPFSLLMHSPVLCGRILELSNTLRFKSLLAPYPRELVTIATAREKDCPYVWAAHAPAARKEGVEEATIELVRDRGGVSGLAPEDRDSIEYTRALLRTHRVPAELFERMRALHGEARLVELTCLIGHYVMVTGLLNACEVAPGEGAEELPLY
jgi:4-carboxymuconolactone decarboxylase